jgi:hypothetical protein
MTTFIDVYFDQFASAVGLIRFEITFNTHRTYDHNLKLIWSDYAAGAVSCVKRRMKDAVEKFFPHVFINSNGNTITFQCLKRDDRNVYPRFGGKMEGIQNIVILLDECLDFCDARVQAPPAA